MVERKDLGLSAYLKKNWLQNYARIKLDIKLENNP